MFRLMTPNDEIQQQAAQWFAAQRRGAMPLDERQAFDAWRADPLHQAALNRMHEVWGELATVGEMVAPRSRGSQPRRRAAIAAALVLSLGLGGGLAVSALWTGDRASAQTGVGEQLSEELPDGSIVALNVVTRARYALNAHERIVHLGEGEAAFVVHKDPERPFLVKVSGYEVRAVGTAFNVRSRDGSLDVAVKEGVVEVRRLTGDRAPVMLRAGQRLQIHDTKWGTPTSADISSIPTAAVDEWRQRVLSYENAPVDQVLRDVNLFYERPVIADPALGRRRVTLRLVIDDRAETMRRLAAVLGADLTDTGRSDRLNPSA
jgi:transmembrane sensor